MTTSDSREQPEAPTAVRSTDGLEAGCACRNWCGNWVRMFGKTPVATNHHPNCQHYNDSLMDVWKVTVHGVSCYVDNEQDAIETAGDEQRDAITVTKEKMHREVFEHLPEFEGF